MGYARGVARVEDRYCPACRRSVEGPWCPDDGVATLRLGGPQVESSALVPGTLIAGRYRVEARLGDGGFGTVFRARHLGTGQPMALKVLRTEPEDRDTLLPRFFQEARITAGLTHPNTVRVFDFGQDERGVVFLAMELVAGKTLTHELGDRVRQGQRFAEAEAAWVVSEVLASLAEAHALGLVHRDLKPDNVMLYGVPGDERARVKVLDFGIVKARNASLTVAGAAPFTPAFASPEQVSGGALDGRSDLYSLGALLFLLLTGEPPFRASTPLELMYMHVVQPAPSLLERPGLGISAAMAGLVARALAKDPDERFADAHTMREALLRCVERHQLEAPHAPTRPRAPALDETDEAPLPPHLRADTDAGASSERARPSGAAATPRVDDTPPMPRVDHRPPMPRVGDTPPMVQAAPRGGDTSPIESITEPPIEDTAPGWTARGGRDPARGPADTTPSVASPAHHGGFVGDTARAVAAAVAPVASVASHASAAPFASHASAVPVALVAPSAPVASHAVASSATRPPLATSGIRSATARRTVAGPAHDHVAQHPELAAGASTVPTAVVRAALGVAALVVLAAVIVALTRAPSASTPTDEAAAVTREPSDVSAREPLDPSRDAPSPRALTPAAPPPADLAPRTAGASPRATAVPVAAPAAPAAPAAGLTASDRAEGARAGAKRSAAPAASDRARTDAPAPRPAAEPATSPTASPSPTPTSTPASWLDVPI